MRRNRFITKNGRLNAAGRGLDRVGNILKWLDLHGTEVSVHFDGDTRYRTVLGALMTIGTFIAVLVYIGERSAAINTAEPSSARQFTELVNLASYPYQNLYESKMDVMFGFFEKETEDNPLFPIALPPQYGSFTLLVGGVEQQLAECYQNEHFINVVDESEK